MFTLTAERQTGERLTLTEYESAYQVTYSGLDAVAAEISTSKRGNTDGAFVNSVRVGTRNIVLTVYISGNVETNRHRLQRFFAPKNFIKLYYKNGERNLYTEGYVETNVCDQFNKKTFAQISIICPNPYLLGAQKIVQEITNVLKMFEFPFSIDAGGVELSTLNGGSFARIVNEGDVDAGVIIRAYAVKDVTGLNIYNVYSGEYMKFSGTLNAGETLVVNTNTRNKSVSVMGSDGTVKNALHRFVHGSSWLRMLPGDNYISFTADAGASYLSASVEFNNLFIGV